MYHLDEFYIVSPVGFDIFAYPEATSSKRELLSALVHAINFCCLESVGFELSDFTAGQSRYHIVRIPDCKYYVIAKTSVEEDPIAIKNILKKVLVDFKTQYHDILTHFDSNITQFRGYEQRLIQILR
jgi:hypothetical protein